MERIDELLQQMNRNTEKIEQLTGSLKECMNQNVDIMTLTMVLDLSLVTRNECIKVTDQLMEEFNKHKKEYSENLPLYFYSIMTLEKHSAATKEMNKVVRQIGGF